MVYIFVVFVYKLNAIVLYPAKSRQYGSMIQTFTSVCSKLEAIGHMPKVHVLDNICCHTIQNVLKITDTRKET